jgi:hypothetical protein
MGAVMKSAVGAIRAFGARPAEAEERCELCGAMLPAVHSHLAEVGVRKMVCACEACGILFSGSGLKYRRVPRQVTELRDFVLEDGVWDSFRVPINLAFFYRNSKTGAVVAVFPGPAGATEAMVPEEPWEELSRANPVLRELEPDVEALLVNRVGETRHYARVPIDECFRLSGILRRHWRGMSGGTAVWREIVRFYEALAARSGEVGA